MVEIQLKIITTDIEYMHLLNNLAVTLFAAHSLTQLDDHGFNLDNGLNDIRAYYDNNLITFVCRYKGDSDYLTKKIMAYAIAKKLMFKC